MNGGCMYDGTGEGAKESTHPWGSILFIPSLAVVSIEILKEMLFEKASGVRTACPACP